MLGCAFGTRPKRENDIKHGLLSYSSLNLRELEFPQGRTQMLPALLNEDLPVLHVPRRWSS
jgi:hypothetical protein